MQETIRFRPEIVAWWPKLLGAGGRLGRVHRWEAAGRGPAGEVHGLEQHHTDTLVLCLDGTARIEDGRLRLDLAAGDALVLRPGTWHRHARLRRGALVYQQGVIAGRSDFFLADDGLRVIASWPEQPAWSLLAVVGATEDENERRQRLADLLGHLASEIVEPLPVQHPAVQAMEHALWEHLHRPDALRRIFAAAGVSRVQAYRLATRHWGLGVASVLRSARLDLARALIDGGMAVGEAGLRCGIPERSVFARAFRRRWGEAPSRLLTASVGR
jgi:AraC-like DNA-binding protein